MGKSINYHNSSKMKKIIGYINQKLKKTKEIRQKDNPFLYINSLLNLFKVTLSEKYLDLFVNNLNTPEIIANSKIYKKFHKNEINNNKKININKAEIKKFNKLFLDNTNNNDDDKTNFEEEYFGEYIDENEDLEENDSDVEEEEDKDENEEEEKEKKRLKNEINDKDIDDNERVFEIKEKINFQQIINNEIIHDLFELEQNDKREKCIKYNNQLLKESKDHSNNLERILRKHKII